MISLLFAAALAQSPQTVRLQVATLRNLPTLQVTAETTWLGEERVVQLLDDGSAPGDSPGDGVYVGEWTGAPVRALPIRLLVQAPGQPRFEVYTGLERVMQPEDRLSFALELGDAPRAQRVAAPYLARARDSREVSWVAASLGWGVLVFAWLAWMLGRALPQTLPEDGP